MDSSGVKQLLAYIDVNHDGKNDLLYFAEDDTISALIN